MDDPAVQTENVRKMLLAFSRDLRVVMLRLASRLQTLRFHAASKRPVSPSLARESLQVFAPLANRLGIWQMKWELEDLSSAFWSRTPTRKWPACSMKSAASARCICSSCASGWSLNCAAAASAPPCRAAQTHLQHRQEDAGKSLNFDQVLDLRACAWWCPP